MRKWEVVFVDGNAVPVPKFEARCQFCGSELILHDFKVYDRREHEIYHLDVHMKCPQCGYFVTFGIPISREEYKVLFESKYHGRILKWELSDIYSDKKSLIEKRLRMWGYW